MYFLVLWAPQAPQVLFCRIILGKRQTSLQPHQKYQYSCKRVPWIFLSLTFSELWSPCISCLFCRHGKLLCIQPFKTITLFFKKKGKAALDPPPQTILWLPGVHDLRPEIRWVTLWEESDCRGSSELCIVVGMKADPEIKTNFIWP